ncbi:MAG: hypothetical protein FWD95_02015 [Nocardioidaceae bacterium]|nr:hypothetical protein [Nocardioidaceae bacterium]
MTEHAASIVASLRTGARLGPDEAARAVLPLADSLASEHAAGRIRGTIDPAYVAPEVAAGQQPTAATDVWSVGALLFHAMAGHTPYEHSPEAPARLRRAGWLGPLVETALATDPARRPSMAEVASHLRGPGQGGESTMQLPPLAPPTASPPTASPPTAELGAVHTLPVGSVDDVPAEEIGATGAIAAAGVPRDRRTPMLALILGALVVIAALIAGILVLGHHGGAPVATPPAGASPSVAPTHSSPSASPTHKAKPKQRKKPHKKRHKPRRPTSGQMESFARRYVATASTSPGAGFRMLTAGYQHASPRYRQFWSAVSGARILSMHADPRQMTVTYRYRYTLRSANGSSTRTENVTLDLVGEGSNLRISGAS